MRSSGKVRPMEEADFPRIAALYERTYGCPENTDSETLHRHLHRVFIDNPWRDPRLPSLVVEQADGNITGSLGVVPRPMMYDGTRIMAAVSHSYIVAPEARSGLSALELVRVFLSGPQDLSMCNGDEASHRIWGVQGGSGSQLYSLSWTKPLRPMGYLLSYMKRRGLPRPLSAGLRPFIGAADSLGRRLLPGALKLPVPETLESGLSAETMARMLSIMARGKKLRPFYTEEHVAWLLETMTINPQRGALRKVLVSEGREVIGWYVYYLRDGEVAELAQLAARDGKLEKVLEHLFWSAYEDDAIAVKGQLEPPHLSALAERGCLFHRTEARGLLLHSRNPELRHAINGGEAFLSRMDSEWWIGELLR